MHNEFPYGRVSQDQQYRAGLAVGRAVRAGAIHVGNAVHSGAKSLRDAYYRSLQVPESRITQIEVEFDNNRTAGAPPTTNTTSSGTSAEETGTMRYKRRRGNIIGPRTPGWGGFNKPAKRRRTGQTRQSGYYGRYQRRSALPVETKFIDISISHALDQTAAVEQTLLTIPQGVEQSQRIGRKAQIKSLFFRMSYLYDPGALADATCVTFVLLVHDTQTNGALPGVSTILTSTQLGTAMMNLENAGRFKIIKRWDKVWGATAGVSGAYNQARAYDTFMYRCDTPIHYSGATGAVTEIRSNNYFLVGGSLGGDDLVSLSGTCRVRYVD